MHTLFKSLIVLFFMLGVDFSSQAQSFNSKDACQEAIKTGGWCTSTANLSSQTPPKSPVTHLISNSTVMVSDQDLVNQALLGAAFGKGMSLTSNSSSNLNSSSNNNNTQNNSVQNNTTPMNTFITTTPTNKILVRKK